MGRMVLNNPGRRDAVSVAMWHAIPLIIDHFEDDPDIRVIVLAGADGKAFVSGADILEFQQQRAPAEAVARYDATSDVAQKRLISACKPTVAMIDGWCIGGGVAEALSCDLRIASAQSRLGVPAASLGLGYRLSGIKKLVDVVGPANAKEIFFTARQHDAAEEQAMGLINRTVPDDEFESFVKSYLETMGENAPITIRSGTRIIQDSASSPIMQIRISGRGWSRTASIARIMSGGAGPSWKGASQGSKGAERLEPSILPKPRAHRAGAENLYGETKSCPAIRPGRPTKRP